MRADGGGAQAAGLDAAGLDAPGLDAPELRGVICDWGGVLTCPIRQTIEAWLDADRIERTGYLAVMGSWIAQAYQPEGYGSPIGRLERGECTEAEFCQLLAAQLATVDGTPVPADGLLRRMFAAELIVPVMSDLIRGLRRAGVRTCLLSNAWSAEAYPRELLPELFDAVVISCEVGMRKPEERIFRHAAGLIGLPPAQCAFIDDIAGNIAAAEAIGMTAILHADPAETVARIRALFPSRPT